MAYSEPRACRLEELPALARLTNRVFRPSGGSMSAEYPLVFREENLEQLRVIDRDGELVSHVGICVREALILGVPLRVASIGAVCTDPTCRGAGLASRLMEDVRAHAIARGADLMLISGGRGLYHRLGYVEVGRFPCYRVPPGAPSAAVSVTEYASADLPAIMALHTREPIRFRRPREDWERVLAAGMLMNQKGTLWVVRQEAQPVAYLAVQRPRPREDGSAGPARVMEYAGDRWAIAEAAPDVIARAGASALDLIGPDGDAVLAAHARARGWEASCTSFSGTLNVIRPESFFAKLAPWIAERLGAAEAARLQVSVGEGEIRFMLDGESYAVDTLGRLTALIFGGDTAEARDVPPLTGRLGETLRALFPMPLLWYGYNYV
jgi:ribosomal protein S18 acetylase RimI-like enzyme